MNLRDANLRELSLTHLQQLVDNRVPEGRAIEYKTALPSGSDADKKEFLADVSALANTEGGILVFGMATERDENGRDTGIPKSCDGIPIGNVDTETQRLSSMLRDSLDPQLTLGVTIRAVPAATSGHFMVVIGVDRSWVGPHRVTFQHSDKYWRRGEAGKYSPDTSELRRVFLEADSWSREADEFHRRRLEEVRRRGKYASHFCLLHILPLGRLSTSLHPRAFDADTVIGLTPMFAMGADWRYNAAGFKVFSRRSGTGEEQYVQWLRFGGAEGAASGFALPQEDPDEARRIDLMRLRAEINRLVTGAH